MIPAKEYVDPPIDTKVAGELDGDNLFKIFSVKKRQIRKREKQWPLPDYLGFSPAELGDRALGQPTVLAQKGSAKVVIVSLSANPCWEVSLA